MVVAAVSNKTHAPKREDAAAPSSPVTRLDVRDVTKIYPNGVTALDHFSVAVGSGMLGVLGPNGAGKSTLLRILATITRPSSGVLLWDGVDIVREPDALRAVLGYLPQDFGVYPDLNAVEFLEYLAALKGLRGAPARQRIDELITVTGLREVARRPLGTYSGGTRQRVGIAQALLNDPRVLLLDEPTQGLDPGQRDEFRYLLGQLSRDRLVILSTHVLSDLEGMTASIAIVNHGRLVAHASQRTLLTSLRGHVWEVQVPSGRPTPADWLVADRRGSGSVENVRVLCGVRPSPYAQRVDPTLADVYAAATKGYPDRLQQ
jgi:ABC-2 type transport system ATP-binding protein